MEGAHEKKVRELLCNIWSQLKYMNLLTGLDRYLDAGLITKDEYYNSVTTILEECDLGSSALLIDERVREKFQQKEEES